MSNNASLYVRANKTLFVTLLLVSGMGIANAAWTAAPGNPPGTNATVPLNVDSTAQFKSGDLGISTTGNPAVGSALEIGGTTKGFLPPRMTTQQRNALTNGLTPAQKTAASGLTIYNTSGPGLEMWNGSAWMTTATTTSSTSIVWTSATSSLQNGINLSKGCFAVNNVCVGGGGGGGGAPGVDGPAFRAALTVNQSNPSGQTWFALSNFTINGTYTAGFNTGDFNLSNGIWQPTVPGKYYLHGHVYSASGYTVLALCKGGQNPNYPPSSNCEVDYAYDHSNDISALFEVTQQDITNASNVFRLWVYSENNYAYGDQNSGTGSYFEGSRIGNPVSYNTTQNFTSVEPPVGAIVFFDGATCPSGWTEYSALNGRYLVGATGSRAVGASATGGTNPLGDRLVRSAGAHTHGFSDSYYGGYATVAMTPTAVNYGYVFAYHNQNSIYNPGLNFNKTTSSTGAEETPAPYLQLRPCKRL